jgi:hypothetical protein
LSDKVTVRVDLDFQLVTNGGANVYGEDSGEIEQAYFAAALSDEVTLLGGVFNNPIGWEGEDAPSLYQTSHSWNWTILDHQTTLHGNNVAGVAVAANMGGFTVTGAVLNDVQQMDEENSIALVLNASPVKGLDLELGYVTQKNDSGLTTPAVGSGIGAGDVLDINASYSINNLTFAGEYFTTGETIDSSILLMANVALSGGFGITGRYETVSFDNAAAAAGVKDPSRVTLAASYEAAKNLFVLAEVSDTDETVAPLGIGEGTMFTLEFVALIK